MADESRASQGFSLSRWSRRKLEAARAEAPVPEIAPVSVAATAVAPAMVSAELQPPPEVALPPVDTLTFDSDFAAFLKPEVDPATQRAALKKLFSDPSFNVMDGLDTYIADYTKPDPMPAGMLEKLANVYAKLTEDAKEEEAPLAIAGNSPASAAAVPGASVTPDVAVEPVALEVAVPPIHEPVVPAAASEKPRVA
ncbi:MAG: DUF3306 domain-containing protein [Casimicrobiaceae bacterium]